LRTNYHFNVDDIETFKDKLLEWSKSFQDVVFLDSNQFKDKYSSYDALIALDAFTALKTNTGKALELLEEYQHNTKDYIFGYLGYDLKNEIEALHSSNVDRLDFPDLYFFQPKKIFFIKDSRIECCYLRMVDDEIKTDIEQINNTSIQKTSVQFSEISSKISREDYIDKVNQVLAHIHRGDIYEMNFCQEFFINEHSLDAENCFRNLNLISKPPFACYLKHENLHAIGASPERFLRKQGNYILSQPIKGTAKRALNPEIDLQLKDSLKTNPKEVSENVMIVDLVRNDLSRIAKKGSVSVEELCKVYSYQQVHQMISTVSAQLKEDLGFTDILRATFPMGSMTGAPKISAMQIIEELESTKRGLYSGCIGYITPEFDFDFNVVIRSILHNSKSKYTSLMVGSAITQAAKPEQEYQECLVKAKALFKVLTPGDLNIE
jgi:para-aminobenzoate synthetase component 1